MRAEVASHKGSPSIEAGSNRRKYNLKTRKKKKRRNAFPFCSALKIFAINVGNAAMKLNLFHNVVFSKQTHTDLFSSYKKSMSI